MSDRFELSFKNKVVRMWLIIMVPTLAAELLILKFTQIPFFSLPSWTIFFIWHYFYRKKQKKEHSVT